MLRFSLMLLLMPAVAFAQTAEVVQKLDAKLDAERAAQRAEDVEILRRLLNKACGLPDKVSVSVSEQSVQRTGGAEDFLRRGNVPVTVQVARASAAVGPFDGVYLTGAGLVYTLHVPAGVEVVRHGERVGLKQSCGTCHTDATAQDKHRTSAVQCSTCHDTPVSPPVPLSDWDRVKQDVRGEKPKTADPTPKMDEKPRAAVCEPGSLQGQITGVLAANGKHVRHLPEKEAISVVVTFDEPAGTAKPIVLGPGSGVTPSERDASFNPFAPTEPLPGRYVKPAGKPGFTPDEVKALTLGDLHLKQGKYKEATDAYATALARFADKEFKLTGPANMTAEQRGQYAEEFQKGVRDAMKSYAKALLLADQPDAAKKALEMATGFVVLEVTPTTVPAKATGPAKLVVTLSKAHIDASKDAAAVKKAVKVGMVNFPDVTK